MKKLLLFFIITLLPVLGNAQKLIDGIYYNLNSSDKTAEVTRGDIKYKNSVRIPTTITYNLVTYDVTKIGAFAFDNCKELTGVTIPNSVTSIGRYAFNYCSHIRNISIPDSVTSIGDHAFYECSRLWSINIPQSVTSIGDYAFSGCSNLTGVYITNLEAWCNIQFSNVSSSPLVYAHRLFINNKEVQDLVIPNSVTSIENYAFYGCSGLKSVIIPNSVTSIGFCAFKSCYGLADVITQITEPFPIQEVFRYEPYGEAKNIYDLATLYVPKNTKAKYEAMPGWQEFRKIVEMETNLPTHKLTYVVDGEEYRSYEIEYGAKITPEPTPTKEGYTFSGWSEIPETMPNHDVTVTGTFTKKPIAKYILTYKVDGEVYKTYEIEEGAMITPEPAPTKEGYTFSGWSEIPQTMPNHDVTVTGTFTKKTTAKYKLTYKVDGEIYKTYEIEEGATITPEPAPTKEGYTFSGWSDIPQTMPDHDVTVTGTFTKNATVKYILTYKVDGEVYKTYEMEERATITPEPAPTKEGYTFSGWSDIPQTMPNHNVTVTGTFIPITPVENIGYVDLGLPSGVLWATCNLGASSPEEVGGYYAWGETSPKTFFSQGNYTYKSNPISLNDISGTEYDAATFALGGTWRMPTREELMELANNCTREETTLNGKACMKFTGPNGNYFYLPKGGFGDEGSGVDLNGYGLWSSTKYGSSTAYRAWEWTSISFSYTWQGIPIRPVTSKKPTDSSNEIAINEESFPDENFRAFLKEQPYGEDGIITEKEIKNVVKIDVIRRNITNLKGIEYFTALTELWCSYNQLTSLDVSGCTALKELWCNDNQLTGLDVSKCTALTWLECYSNQLTSLDVSKNSVLTTLGCYNNQLTSLDVSKNSVLTTLGCYNNQLTSLDVSGCTVLTQLWCNDNQLTSLNVSGCTSFTWLGCYNNKIKGEAMDALVGSLPNCEYALLYIIDLSNSSEENECTTLQVNVAKGKGWRVLTSYGNDYEGSDPSGIQGITLENNVNTSIYDLNGRRLKEPSKGINIIGGKKVLNH